MTRSLDDQMTRSCRHFSTCERFQVRHQAAVPSPSASHHASSMSRRPARMPSRVTVDGGGTNCARRSKTRSRSAPFTRVSRCHSVTSSRSCASSEHARERGRGIGRVAREIDRQQRLAKCPRHALVVGSPRPLAGARDAHRSGGHERFTAAPFESHPTDEHVHEPLSAIVHRERVGTPQIDGRGRSRFDRELPRGRPDRGVQRPPFELQAMIAAARADETKPRAGLDADPANRADV